MPTPRALHPRLPETSMPPGTKGRILNSALASFAALGYSGASMRTIAEATGINAATVYSHFPSKEHILAALVSTGSHELLARIEAALVEATSPEERFDAIIGATVGAHVEYPLLAVVTNGNLAALGPDLAVPATSPTTEAAALLREILADGLASGAFDIPDLDITAHVLEGMAQQIPTWVDPEVDDPGHVAKTFIYIARRIVSRTLDTTGADHD